MITIDSVESKEMPSPELEELVENLNAASSLERPEQRREIYKLTKVFLDSMKEIERIPGGVSTGNRPSRPRRSAG